MDCRIVLAVRVFYERIAIHKRSAIKERSPLSLGLRSREAKGQGEGPRMLLSQPP